jgi:hypothetical protein
MAVTGYSVFYDYDFGQNLRNVAIMNIGSVDPNFTGSRALAGPGNASLLDQNSMVQSRNITASKVDKPKVRTAFRLYL